MTTTDIRPDRAPDVLRLRHVGWAGPAYAFLLVVAAVTFPAPPGGDVVAAAHPSWLAGHSGAVIAQSLLRSLAALSFAVLGTAAAAHVRRAAPEAPLLPLLAAVGGALSAGLMLASQALGEASALAVRAHDGATAIRALGSCQEALLDASSLPATLLFAAVGLAVLRSGTLPRWFGVTSMLGVPIGLVDAASFGGGPLEPVALVGLVWFLAWSLVAGVQLVRAR